MILLAALGLLAAAASAATETATETAPRPRPLPRIETVDPRAAADLFAMPEIAADIRLALARAAAGDPAGGALPLDRDLAGHPGLAPLQAARAVIAMLAGDGTAALDHLGRAAAAGLPGLPEIAADPLFAPLAADPALGARLAALAALPPPDPAPPPAPAPVTNGRALVGADNTAWDPETGRLAPRFAFAAAPDAPVLPRTPRTAAYDLLRDKVRHGRAAGNHGDLYDNRDRGHSRLDPERHPQLAHVAYAPAARAADIDYGLADRLLFDHPTLGNSSTAVTGPAWRSLPRLAMTRADGTGPLGLWQNASRNQLYVYPAHRDYGMEQGDLFPANTPYILVSDGSSGSDQPFLEAVAMILAAFRPDTKARLEAENLVVPTVQMVFRRSLRNVTSRADYFGAAANPAAFEGLNINLARMVSLASSIAPDAIPPQVRLKVVEEDLGTPGVDFFGDGLSEQLFDTPAAVARIWRSKAGRRSLVVSAAETTDPNGRKLGFEWHLLQGDPAKVRIEPAADGLSARITLDWHEPFRISKDNPVLSSRIDIGVFASNGAHDSAPAILSWYCPPSETRRYEPGPDGAPRLVAIDYADPKKAATYADPMLIPRADWRDDYAADAAGWTRHHLGGAEERFTADGRRLLDPGGAGEPARSVAAAYPLDRDAEGRLEVTETDAAPF